MAWKTRYLPPDPNQWRGRSDTPPDSSFFQTIKILNLLEHELPECDQLTFALLGFRCDEGIRRNSGRIGAAEGPASIRNALSRLPVQKQNFICYDVGNITCADGDLEVSQHALGVVVAKLLKAGIKPILLGGGHEMAWGHYQGIATTFPQKTLGIVNFDSHFDMRPLLEGSKGTSGTPFLQIAKSRESAKLKFDYNCVGIQHLGNVRQLFDTARAHETHIIYADELHQGLQEKCIDFIDRVIDQNELIYVTLCLDVFSAAFAPGVSASQALGLAPWNIIPMLKLLAASGKVVSFDIAELSPRYDVDQRTAKLAAALIFEFIHSFHIHSSW